MRLSKSNFHNLRLLRALRALAMTGILMASVYLVFAPAAYASDVDVYNVSLVNFNDAASPKTVDVKFDVSQDNTFSGTDDNTQSYYDRVYIFVKYWDDSWASTAGWEHATFIAGGTITTYTNGVGITADGMGAFCSPGTNQTVRWEIGTDEGGVAGTDTFKVRVFAIEMVLIPTGDFWVGDTSSSATFYESNGGSSPYKITSEDAIDVGSMPSNLYYAFGGNAGDGGSPIPALFPKGHDAFYIMKYEISQGQYVDFLNTLTRAQQDGRTQTDVTTDEITNIYVMINSDTESNRNTIVCPASGNGTTDPITFSTTTPERACGFISWADGCAYADWAGLRPMTELEFEKACRGGSATDNTVVDEYAWGTATIASLVYTLENDGAANEGIDTNYSTTVGNCSYTTTDGNIDGPLRCGIFAAHANSTGRMTAGASYYGVMEMSGNLWERPVTVGHGTGRSFTGAHGDGSLDASGDANASNWPGTDAVGGGQRGGSWDNSTSYTTVSSRTNAAWSGTLRDPYYGGRCVRTSP